MFVELIELLRCPRAHEEAQLVASATRTEERHILQGVLGCPVCDAEFPIRDAIAWFDEVRDARLPAPAAADAAVRLAAFLELTDGRGFALLCGTAAIPATELFQQSETPLVLLNPSGDATSPAVIGVVMSRLTAPFAAASARAAGLDPSMSGALVQSAVRAVRPGGRIMGPVAMPIPDGVNELARDDRDWVGERTSTTTESKPRLVTLKRGPR